MLSLPRRLPKINSHILATAVVIWSTIGATFGWAQDRVALLIGNGDYDMQGMDLLNPVNDINALHDKLQELGFESRKLRDADSVSMATALDWFADKAKGADMAMVFYAGHGAQLNGDNYLIGTDMAELSASGLTSASVTLSRIKAVMDAAKPDIGIVVLDACRDNPLTENDLAQQGLAVASGGQGLLIAYATDPGNVAYDGSGNNSVFTAALVNNIATDGLDVRIMFGRVRQEVVRTSFGAQIPWVEESVLGEHYFGDPDRSATAVVDDELVLWRGISGSTDPADFETYLADYPDGLFSGFAKARLEYLANPVPYQPITGDNATSVILASADTAQVATSLGILGYMPQTRGLALVDKDVIDAFDAYRAALPDPHLANLTQLDTDAARLTVFLAAATGQRIRTDMAALSSVEKTLTVAEDAFGQLKAAAGDNPDYKPIIDEARGDVDAIVAAREAIRQRLDGSRTYYETLVLTAQDHYGQVIGPDLLTGNNASRSLGDIGTRMQTDAAVFLKHVQLANERTRGSYAWMTDFITKP